MAGATVPVSCSGLRVEQSVLPRLVLRVRRAVRRLQAGSGSEGDVSGADTQARWDAMLYQIDERRRAAERRLAEAERALNELGRD